MAVRPAVSRLSRQPLPSLILLLIALAAVDGCMDTVLQKGTMNDNELLGQELVQPGSCACCGLCNHRPDCASLSFNPTSGQCRLYRTVPDYSRLRVDNETELFVMPGRSGHRQFCRQDSDCQAPNDQCFGRVCTTDRTLTCRDLVETHSAPQYGIFYGSIDGTLLPLQCRRLDGIDGWTLIAHSPQSGPGWSGQDVFERNIGDPTGAYSILRRAETLRTAGSEARVQIAVLGKIGAATQGFRASIPTTQTLISGTDTIGADLSVESMFGNYRSGNTDGLRVPWIPPAGSAAMLSLREHQGPNFYFRTIINQAGTPYLNDNGAPHSFASYYIRE